MFVLVLFLLVNHPDCFREWTVGRSVALIVIAAAFVRNQVAPKLPFPAGITSFRGQ